MTQTNLLGKRLFSIVQIKGCNIMQSILTSTVIATLISSILAIIISNKKNKLMFITNERQQWRIKIREIGEKISKSSKKEEIAHLLTELKLRINSYGINNKEDILHDGHIWEIIYKYENYTGYELNTFKDYMTRNLSLLMKYDWERSKKETSLDVSNWIIVIANFTTVAIHLCIIWGKREIFNLSILMFFMKIVSIPIMISWFLYLFTEVDDYTNKKKIQKLEFWKLQLLIAVLWLGLLLTCIFICFYDLANYFIYFQEFEFNIGVYCCLVFVILQIYSYSGLTKITSKVRYIYKVKKINVSLYD